MRTPTRVLLGLGAATIVAAGGTAFTESNTLNGNNVAGYGTDAVSGATTTRVEHTLSADGAYIVSTSLTFAADANSDPQVKAGFETDNMTNCAAITRTDLSLAYDTTCNYNPTQYPTATSKNFRVAVS